MKDKYERFHDMFIAMCKRLDVDAAYVIAKPDGNAVTHTLISGGQEDVNAMIDEGLAARDMFYAMRERPTAKLS